ncbi:hypothetical protein NL676_039730 [Syzygium grande]|nr:hypothetical protein NL676_039730 [Syzygium grande]
MVVSTKEEFLMENRTRQARLDNAATGLAGLGKVCGCAGRREGGQLWRRVVEQQQQWEQARTSGAASMVVGTAMARTRTKAVSSVAGADGNSTVRGEEQRARHEWPQLQVEAPSQKYPGRRPRLPLSSSLK